MRNYSTLFMFFLIAFIPFTGFAQEEQVLLNENFQGWTAASASTGETVIDKTTFYGDPVKYTLVNVAVMPAYLAKGDNGVTTVGALQTQKVDPANSYVVLSGFPNVSRAVFKHSYTGGSRGCIISVKGDGDADWVVLLNANTTAAAGQNSEFTVNKTNVSFKFSGNLASQNAYLHDIIVYGTASKVVPVLKSSNYVNGDVIPVSGSIVLVYSQPVLRNTGNITLGNTVISDKNLVFKGDTVFVNYSGLSTDEAYRFFVPAGAFKGEDGTPVPAETAINLRTADTKAPLFSKISVADGSYVPVNGFISLVLSEPVIAGQAKITLGPKSLTAAVSGSNSNLVYINYSGLDYDKDYTLQIPANAITDPSGNSFEGLSVNIHTEIQAAGDTLLRFIPDATSVPSTSSGAVKVNTKAGVIEFGNVQSAGTRNAESYTYSFKTSYVLLPALNSVGELSIYCQSGGGTVPQEYLLEKMNIDSTWSVVETVIMGTNDRNMWRIASAQSTAPVTFRIKAGDAPLWVYEVSAYSFKKVEKPDDGKNPSVVSVLPENLNNTAPVNGSIKLIFSEDVYPGSGKVTLNGVVLTPSVIANSVTLPYNNLSFESTYNLVVQAGAFVDAQNNPSVVFNSAFTTKVKPVVEKKLFDFIVAKDGTGNGTTIQSAFNAAPAGSSVPYVIFVKEGIYDERPSLPDNKTNICLIGASKDDVIITGNKRSGVEGFTTSTCQTMEIFADNFYCENMTIRNTAGVNAGQAVALKVYADKAVFKNVRLLGYQDTHLTSNNPSDRQYYLNCDIHGTVDFIFNDGSIFFDHCLIYIEDRTTGNVICAPATSQQNAYGYVFSNCTIDGASSQDGVYSLGRPWQNKPRAVYINTKMNILPSAGAWTSMGAIPALFAEYGSVNASGNPVNVSARNTAFSYTSGSSTVNGSSPKAVLSAEEAAAYTLENVTKGSDNWNARLKTETTAAASNLRISDGKLYWNHVDGARCYGVGINETTIINTIDNNVNINLAGSQTVEVVAFNEYGAASIVAVVEINNGQIVTAVSENKMSLPELKSTIVYDKLEIANFDMISGIEVFDLSGRLMLSESASGGIVNMSAIKGGLYMLKMNLTTGKALNIKFIKK